MTLVAVIGLFPTNAGAFWPFSTPADAAGNASPLLHDSSITLLDAATNVDPNPGKGVSPVSLSGGAALVADSGPSGTAADIAGQTSRGKISLYIVREGDTLGDISKMFGVSVNTLVWANNLGSTKAIHPGQSLVILPVSGVEHTVVKGDTFASIAKKYHSDAGEIAEFNGLDDGAALTLGAVLIVPGGEFATQVTTAVKGKKSIVNPYRGGSGAEVDGYYSNPVPGAVLTQSIHGWNGIDLGAPRGTPIFAAASGIVIVAKNNGAWNGGYGNYVVLTHDNGTQTLYGHMTHTVTAVGQSIVQGQLIGYVGATGEATGPHLHFEVRGAKNPFAFCPVGAICQPR